MPYNDKVEPLITTREPIGCHLQAIKSVGGCFSIASGAKEFDALLKRNHGHGDGYAGEYFTGTIVSISVPDEKTVAALKKRGFVLLGTQKAAHDNSQMALYGLGFTLPRRISKKEKEA